MFTYKKYDSKRTGGEKCPPSCQLGLIIFLPKSNKGRGLPLQPLVPTALHVRPYFANNKVFRLQKNPLVIYLCIVAIRFFNSRFEFYVVSLDFECSKFASQFEICKAKVFRMISDLH